ncbi:MAG: MFS transporter, partial [Sphingomonadaceae bacterium]|nr:MFS transporter [Sphingomonadaceae bacterium]
IIGIWGGGWLGDRLGSADRGAYARIPAVAFVIAAPCYAVGVLSDSLPLTYVMFLIPQALGLMWLGPVLSAVQHIAPASMSTTASASFLFINNLIGIGLGTVLFGLISDRLAPSFGDESLRYSILIGLSFYLLSAGLFFLASRRLDRDWEG